MKNLILNLVRDEDGQGMVEYGIIIALISVVAIAAVKLIGGKVNGAFESTSTALTKEGGFVAK
ncbi:MAG: Flp family type IVb pilin [Candidatus Sericytochromatia bacterium]|nr:Flp family type IVb pilin [Candidatus Sericytochromatia bacterium]